MIPASLAALALSAPAFAARTLEYPLSGNDKAVLHLFLDQGPKAPFILMLPMTGDPHYRFSNGVCSFMSKNGFRCGYLERTLPEPQDMPKTIAETLKLPSLPPLSSKAARKALDELERQGILAHGERIGIGGISLGAIDAAIVSLTDKRVGAAALFLGGGDLAEAMTRIKGLAVKDFSLMRERQMKANGWSLEDFRREIKPYTLASDPLTYAEAPDNPLPGDRYLMINIAGDSAILNSCSDKLAAALTRGGAKPDYELLSLWFLPPTWRHLGAMLYLGHAEKRMLGHFQKHLR